MSSATTVTTVPASPPVPPTDQWYPLRRSAEAILAPLVALLGAAVLFSIFLLFLGASPLDFLDLVWRGAFGSWFSIQNTVQRASPLLLTALCVALPGQLGLVIIGGEAAVVLGGLAATVAALPLVNTSPVVVWAAMAVAGSAMGAFWIGLSGWLRARLNVNEVIASLVLAYVGLALFNHFVEGVLRDPASLNKPSTYGIGDQNMLDTVPWLDVHPGLPVGILACVLCWVLIYRTSVGLRLACHRRQYPSGAVAGVAGDQVDPAGLRHRWRLCRPSRRHRGRGRVRTRQRVAQRRIRLHRHPDRLPRPVQPAGDHADGDPARRLGRGRRTAAAADGPARRNDPGAARPDLRFDPGERHAIRTLPLVPAARRCLMEAIGTVLLAMLAGSLRVSTPFLFVSLGECLTEKSGRINLGNEGVLVLGAMVAYATSYETGSPWVGVAAAAFAGLLLGGLHGAICSLARVNGPRRSAAA